MAMQIKDFYTYTPREFFAYRKGFLQMREADLKQSLLLTRKLMFASIMPHARKGLKETDIMEFEWENEAVQNISAEDLAEQQKEFQESLNFWKRIDAIKGKC